MGTTDSTVDAVRRALEPLVAAMALELYDVELHGTGAARVLRVTVDRPGGVDLDAIADATRAVSDVLDAQPALAGPYLLEVSSPGIERPLRTPAHFKGALGSTVSVKHRTADGARRTHGVLVDAGESSCTVQIEDGEIEDGRTERGESDGAREEIAYGDVTQARTVFEWTAPERPGRRRAGAGAAGGSRGSKGAHA